MGVDLDRPLVSSEMKSPSGGGLFECHPYTKHNKKTTNKWSSPQKTLPHRTSFDSHWIFSSNWMFYKNSIFLSLSLCLCASPPKQNAHIIKINIKQINTRQNNNDYNKWSEKKKKSDFFLSTNENNSLHQQKKVAAASVVAAEGQPAIGQELWQAPSNFVTKTHINKVLWLF